METETMIRPFSNGSQAMDWYYNNCEQCVKAYFPKKDGEWPSCKTMKAYCSIGKECKLKYQVDIGFITGEIPLETAKKIGYTEEKGFPCSCMMFSDNNDDGFKAPKRPKPDNTPDNQMVLPFLTNDILKGHEKREEVCS